MTSKIGFTDTVDLTAFQAMLVRELKTEWISYHEYECHNVLSIGCPIDLYQRKLFGRKYFLFKTVKGYSYHLHIRGVEIPFATSEDGINAWLIFKNLYEQQELNSEIKQHKRAIEFINQK